MTLLKFQERFKVHFLLFEVVLLLRVLYVLPVPVIYKGCSEYFRSNRDDCYKVSGYYCCVLCYKRHKKFIDRNSQPFFFLSRNVCFIALTKTIV